MYVAAGMFLAGVSLVMANVAVAASGALGVALLWKHTAIEEAKLIERYGEAYRHYMQRTGRFWPRARTS